MLGLASCALPSIHREPSPDAATVSRDPKGAAPAMDPSADTDAGALVDPEKDPANRNEDYETFLTLVPKAHV